MQLPLFEVISTSKAKALKRQPKLAVHQATVIEPPHPQTIIDHVIDVLGSIDLDPYSTIANVPAKQCYKAADDALLLSWQGRVWLNPPTGRIISAWVDKLCHEYETGDVTSAILLLPARTNTLWWQKIAGYPYCALQGRLEYVKPDGKRSTSSSASAIIYLGPQLARFAKAFSDIGTIYIPYIG